MTRPDDATVLHRINRERAVVGAWGRAVLLQVAHPLVAAGVAEHSDFDAGTVAYLRRTRRTIGAMLGLTFGSERQVTATADGINGIHRRVHGRLTEATRRYPAGTRYSATDPALLAWVHATLVESQLLGYRQLVGPLTREDADAYCRATADGAARLGLVPDALPGSEPAVADYLETRYADGTIEVTETARRVARALLFPRAPLLRLALLPGTQLTLAWLPDSLREAYGFSTRGSAGRRAEQLCAFVRWTRRWTPGSAWHWRLATRPDRASTGLPAGASAQNLPR